MGKKNKKKNTAVKGGPVLENTAALNDADTLVLEAEANKEETKVEEIKANKKADKAEVKGKKKAKKEKKESKVAKKAKETVSELKKVTWPTFGQTMKKTGVVIGVVIFFGLVLFAFDYILTTLTKLLAGSAISETQKWVSVGLAAAVVVGAAVWLTIWLVRRKKGDRR